MEGVQVIDADAKHFRRFRGIAGDVGESLYVAASPIWARVSASVAGPMNTKTCFLSAGTADGEKLKERKKSARGWEGGGTGLMLSGRAPLRTFETRQGLFDTTDQKEGFRGKNHEKVAAGKGGGI